MFAKQKITSMSLGITLLALGAMIVFAFAATHVAHASACSELGKDGTSVIACDDSKGRNPIFNLLLLVLNILTGGVGIVAVGGIVYGAILYATAQDSASQVQKAKAVIGNVVLGIIAFALMFAFLQYLIPGGVFN